MRYIAILGRQPALGMAELERVFDDARWFSHDSAIINGDSFDIERLGGTVRAGQVVMELSNSDWRKTSMEVVRTYYDKWSGVEGKMTLGISVYGFTVSPRDVQRTGLILKGQLKSNGVSLRLIPNDQAVLSSATSHHNKLGLSPNKVELIIVKGHGGKVVVAESTGSQNITSLARRDRERPARDAFVGMLPPKLAQIMINLAVGSSTHDIDAPRVLDPFCGTGVILQEASLLGYAAYGTDLSDKMVDYSRRNLEWLASKHQIASDYVIEQADAMDAVWSHPISAVACESYLGQPFSAPPSAEKLEQVRGNCDYIISEFLRNIAPQLEPGTSLCVAVPAWRGREGELTHLPLIKKVEQLGFVRHKFKNIDAKELLYFRPEQVVARELLVLQKS